MNEVHGDAELCFITGDLNDHGHHKAYHDMREIVRQLKMPFHPLIGNHDHREIFTKVFPEVPLDEHGYVQQMLVTELGRFLLLDMVEHGKHWGSYCEKRSDWLQNQLKDAGSEAVYLFMHHPPFNIGIPSLDFLSLKNDTMRIQDIVCDFSNIKHLFFGHVHRPVSGSWHGIPFTTLGGTNHQFQLDLNAVDYLPYSHEPPAYCVLFLEHQQTTVHFHDYFDDSLYLKMSLNTT